MMREPSSLKVDKLKTLVRRTRPALGILDQIGGWQVDDLARAIPWHSRETMSDDDPHLFARIAIQRAADAAAGALGRVRGRRDAQLRVRHRDGILNGRLPDLLENLPSADDPRRLLVKIVASQAAVALGAVDAEPDTLRAAAIGAAGDRADIEATIFVRHLAEWWWRNTSKRPERRRKLGERADLRRKGRATSFVTFAIAAWADAGGGVLSEKTIRRALET